MPPPGYVSHAQGRQEAALPSSYAMKLGCQPGRSTLGTRHQRSVQVTGVTPWMSSVGPRSRVRISSSAR